MTPQDLLDRVCIVLVEPSHAGNVGACARAMKTMGIGRLVLVNPRFTDVLVHEEAIAMASGATDVLQSTRIVSSTADALLGVQFAIGLSARQRELAPPVMGARQGVAWVFDGLKASVSSNVALVFGPERTGLSNDDLLLCQRQIMIEANPVYSSLNLSQAVQVLCYELRQTMLNSPNAEWLHDITLPMVQDSSSALAGADDINRLSERFIQAMSAVDFLNPERPKKLIPRIRRLLSKAGLEREEVDLLHGFLSDVNRVAEGRWYKHELKRINQQE